MKLLNQASDAPLSKELEKVDTIQAYQRILVADDLGPGSAAVFEQALMIASRTGAELLIAHAADATNVIELSFMPAEAYDEWVRKSEESDRKQLQPAVEQARKAGVEAQILTLTGGLTDAILEAARERKVDLIVMGHHQRRNVARMFAGSAALHIARHAPCPSLLVPEKSS